MSNFKTIYEGYSVLVNGIHPGKDLTQNESRLYNRLVILFNNKSKYSNVLSAFLQNSPVKFHYFEPTGELLITIPAKSVLTDKKQETLTINKANNLIVKQTRNLFSEIINNVSLANDIEPELIGNPNKQEVMTMMDSLVDKMNLPAWAMNQRHVVYQDNSFDEQVLA